MKNNKWKRYTAIGATAILLAAALTGCAAPQNDNLIGKIDNIDDVIEDRVDAVEDKAEAAIEEKIEAITSRSGKLEDHLSAQLTEEQAKDIAVESAGVNAADITNIRARKDGNDYDIEFTVNGVEYEYEVNISSGKITEVDRDREETVKPEAVKQESTQTGLIGKEKAKNIALEHAGVKDVSWVKVELDDGKYEVDFTKDGIEYDYEIGAVSGKVIKAEKERDDDYRAPVKQESTKTELIGKEKAKSIALKHAGVSNVSWVKVELDDGKYEVDFTKDGIEYDYDINAVTGKVIKAEKERDDDYRAPVKQEEPKKEEPVKQESANTELIGKDKAKSIALKHAGVSGVSARVELDDGKYEVEFRKDGIEYDYEIGAKSGKVIKAEKERDDD